MTTTRALIVAAVLAVAGFAGYAFYVDGRGAVDDGSPDGPLTIAGDAVARGRYLATAADCGACHSVPGEPAYSGGLAFRLPFGTIYSANLTPDRVTGIGAWSEEDFLRAVRSGVAPGGRHLYPAHPYTAFAGMARNDVLAIRAYLMSLPATGVPVPESDLRFPFSQRWLMPLWNALFLDGRRFRADPAHDATWNRGAYLATALGHCGECHTPRNVAFALKTSHALEGAVTQGWKAYNLTPTAAGIGTWSAAELDEYLAAGHAAGHGATTGPMKEVVAYSTSGLTAEDRAALVAYLLTGAPGAAAGDTAPAAVPATASGSGGVLYAGTCAGCHPLDPVAGAPAYADLRGARTVRDPDGTNLLRLLAVGSPHGAGTGLPMPDFGHMYSDTERAAVANFVLGHWGHVSGAITPNRARAARESN